MALLLYGIYDKVSTELGQTPLYLDDEISPDEIRKAKGMAGQWLADLSADPDLSRDTRVAVPISQYPGGGPVRYWATGGVRLERVKYTYVAEPDVQGVEPVFVPTFYYLPTDISLEFEKSGAGPLTREEFRNICDGCRDEAALRRRLGARSDSDPRTRQPVVIACIIAVLIIVGFLLFRKTLSQTLIRAAMRLALLAVALLLVIGIVVLVVSPSRRLKFIVRHVAGRNTGLGLLVQMRLFYPYCYEREPPAYVIRSLADLLSDENPQVRYLAVEYLGSVLMESPRDPEAVAAIRDIEGALRTAAADPVAEVAGGALMLLGNYRNEHNIELLRSRLRTHKGNEPVCVGALVGLSRIPDAKALDEILPYTKDPRRGVRFFAISQLGRYGDERAALRIAELLQAPDELSVRRALSAVRIHNDKDLADSAFSKTIDPVLLAGARTVSFSAYLRGGMADNIADIPSRILAYESLLTHPSAGKHETAEDCQVYAANQLGGLKSEAASAVPALQKTLEDPNTKPKARRAVTDALKRIQETE
jgi:HEAT repeat protein